MKVAATLLVLLFACSAIRAQDPAPPVVDPLHQPFDEILDIYVRDGLVYYLRPQGRARQVRSLRAIADRDRRRNGQGLDARTAAGVLD